MALFKSSRSLLNLGYSLLNLGFIFIHGCIEDSSDLSSVAIAHAITIKKDALLTEEKGSLIFLWMCPH